MTDPVFPAGYTQGLVPGMVPNAQGLLPSIQDYLVFVYTQNTKFVIDKQLGELGEALIAYRNASQVLNKVYALATNPAVTVDRNGSPLYLVDVTTTVVESTPLLGPPVTLSTTTTSVPLSAVPPSSTVTVRGSLTTTETTTITVNTTQVASVNNNVNIANGAIAALFGPDNPIYSQLEALQGAPTDVLDDLKTFQDDVQGGQGFTGWVNWYGSVSAQDNLLNAQTAVQSLNNIAQAKFLEVMFIYETFVKGASSILSNYGQIVDDVAINIRQN